MFNNIEFLRNFHKYSSAQQVWSSVKNIGLALLDPTLQTVANQYFYPTNCWSMTLWIYFKFMQKDLDQWHAVWLKKIW